MNKDNIKEMLMSSDYDFIKNNKYLGNNIMVLGLGGSLAYGTNISTSDIDIRGFSLNPISQVFGIENDFEQVADKSTDTTIYSLLKMIKLLMNCNPNTIEILGLRPKDYIYINNYGQRILDIKQAFLSKIAIDKFGGYARAQYNRLESGLLGNGHNDDKKIAKLKHSLESIIESFNIKHKNNTLNLTLDVIFKEKDLARWEKMKHTEKSELIGEDLLITGKFEDYPITEFKTLISEIHKTQSEYGNINKRNHKKTDAALCKHMMHLVRLFFMGTDLNRECKIKTYRDGKEHDVLMDIRNGKYMYEDGFRVRPEFYDLLHDIQDTYQESVINTILPEKPNTELINHTLISIYKDVLINGTNNR